MFAFTWVMGALTGGLANPIRSIGPALASSFQDGQAAYWIGPIAAAVAAAAIIGKCIKA
jgi:glycerol uptake facilitator-like aquaporin